MGKNPTVNEGRAAGKVDLTRRQAIAAAGGVLAGAVALPAVLRERAYAATGENLAVSVPTKITYYKQGNALVGPSPEACVIKNESDREVRVKQVRAVPSPDYNLVNKASESGLDNAVSITMGPEADQLNLADYTEATDVGNAQAWTMSTASSNESLSKLSLTTAGEVNNLEETEGEEATIGRTEWYLSDDTITNEVMDELADHEERITTVAEETTALKEQVAALEKLVSVGTSAPASDSGAVLWYNPGSGAVKARQYVTADSYTKGGWAWRELIFADAGTNGDVYNATADTPGS